MSSRPSPVRLRRQLVLLALLALLPMLALALYGAVDQRRQTTARLEREASRLLQLALTQQDALLASVESRLEGLALAPESRIEPHVGCDSLLRTLDRRWADMTGLGLFEPDGQLQCSSRPDRNYRPPPPASVGAFVARTLAAGDFTVGRSFHESASGLPVVVVGLPVRAPDGRITDVLTAAVRLQWLPRFAHDAALPPHATLALLDGTGRVLFRAPAPARWVGQSLADSALFQRLRVAASVPRAAGAAPIVDGAGLDGEARVYAVARLAGPADAAPYLYVGLSRARAVAAADRVLRRDLLRVGALTLLALVAAVLLGELLVLRRVRALVAATERIAGGRLDLGTGVPHDAGEVGRIAEAVDRMTVALRARAAEAEQAVAALRRGEERYRSLVVGTSQIVWTTDATGAVNEDLPSWRAVTGQTLEEMRGFGWFDAIHPDDRDRARAAIERAPTRRRLSTHCRLRTASGEYRHYAVHGVPLVEADGVTIREWVGFCVDVTEQRAAEDALRRSEEAQRQGQKLEAVGRLAGGIAHDFNNLLTAIRSYSELLLENDQLGAEPRGDVEEIQKAADRAAALVRQLLAFSRRQPVRAALLDVDAVVRDMDGLLRRLIGTEYVLAITLNAPDARVRADRAQLEQVVLNLALNARDAMPNGGTIAVSTAIRAAAAADDADDANDADDAGATAVAGVDAVELTVRDTGIGMDEATRSRIFEPFFTTKAPGAGTGLGLATVYGAVQQAGGRVEVDSAPGAGTTFRVLLPRAAENARAATPAASTPAPRPTDVRAPSSRGTVLLADDETSLRSAAARVLRRAGHTVLEAEDGEAALALWRRHRDEIGLLLTDVRMPRLNGVELAERVRDEAPELPVVFMTGFAAELAARAERTIPGAPRIEKPFEVRAFVEAVEAALGRTASRS